MSTLQDVLLQYDLEIVGHKRDFSEVIGKGESWKFSSLWSSWATCLDDGFIVFFLPDTHKALTILTGKHVDYIPTRILGSKMTLYLVGYCGGELPFGPFWSEKFTDKLDQISSHMRRKLHFAKQLQETLKSVDGERSSYWMKSYRDGVDYLSIHRQTVRAVGKLVDIDMNDHDLTKTRIVQIALGFLWHWPGERELHEIELKDAANDTVRAGHLELENHHPEFEQGHFEALDVYKMLTDRVSVHLQKDPRDSMNGWDININFIPINYREEWYNFVEVHKDKNLYPALEQAKYNTRIDSETGKRTMSRSQRTKVIDCCC